jgi:hypothetical protein
VGDGYGWWGIFPIVSMGMGKSYPMGMYPLPSLAESCPRVRTALERGGVSPEGASSRRARQSFAEGASSPRARRSFGVTAPGPSSEAEFCPRGAGAGCLLGRWCHSGRSCMRGSLTLVSSFAFLLFCEEMGFFLVIRDPYGCPQQN